jgi:hypothetical protein
MRTHQETVQFDKELIVCVLGFDSFEAAIADIGELVRFPRRVAFSLGGSVRSTLVIGVTENSFSAVIFGAWSVPRNSGS